MSMHLKIIGLGPGSWEDLTLRARQELFQSKCLIFRTEQHPMVAKAVEQGIKFTSCDKFYDNTNTFPEVYDNICKHVIEKFADNNIVHYAVPGHPLVLEKTVTLLIAEAKQHNIKVSIISGISVLDAIYSSLKIDPAGISVLDALNMPKKAVWAGQELLITQVYNKLTAGDLKLLLLEEYSAEHQVKVLKAVGVAGQEQVTEVPLFQLDWQDFDHLTSVYVPATDEIATSSIWRLEEILEILRSPAGCPWDREQTHQSLQTPLLEESYEVLEALQLENMDMLCEELGDLLLQIAFHAQIARENSHFSLKDIILGINKKMVRRHPHVFGNIMVSDTGEVLHNWEQIKLREKSEGKLPAGLLDNITTTLPALMQAEKVQAKAARVGFDWDHIDQVWKKVSEEIEELHEAKGQDDITEEIGDVLFAVVNLARFLKVDCELALLQTVQKFKRRFRYIEKKVRVSGKEFSQFTLQELDGFWEEAKKISL